MSSSRLLASLVLAVGLVFGADIATGHAPDEATQLRELPDAKIDAFLLGDDPYGIKGAGERNRFLSELNPTLYAELRALRRRLQFAAPEDRAAATSEILDLYNRVSNWISGELRHAPLDALDEMLATQRASFSAVKRIGADICGPDVWSWEVAGNMLNEAAPDIVAALDNASYRAIKAARARPATYPPPGEWIASAYFKALESAGVSETDIVALFAGDGLAELTPERRCELGRRVMDALASLPDDVRGPVLASKYGDDDGSDE